MAKKVERIWVSNLIMRRDLLPTGTRVLARSEPPAIKCMWTEYRRVVKRKAKKKAKVK